MHQEILIYLSIFIIYDSEFDTNFALTNYQMMQNKS
jgi:hypothetical protein